MHLVVVGPKNFEHEDALEFSERQDRLPLRLVIASCDHIGRCRPWQRVNACHQRAHEALDVPAEARRGRWPVIDAHPMLLAAPLEGPRMEFGSIIEAQ